MTNVNELACTYSTLILTDDNIPVTAEKINTLLKAANVNVESIWPTLFARAVSHVNVRDLITNIGSASAAPAPSAVSAAAPAAAAAASDSKKEEKKKEEKKEESEEEDEDMGFGLFD